jgi:hypothetical protein
VNGERTLNERKNGKVERFRDCTNKKRFSGKQFICMLNTEINKNITKRGVGSLQQ